MFILPVRPRNGSGLLAQETTQGCPVAGHHADGIVIVLLDDYLGYQLRLKGGDKLL